MRIFSLFILLTLPLFSCCEKEEKKLSVPQETAMPKASSKRLESLISPDIFNVLKISTKAVYYPVKADRSKPQGYEPLDHSTELPSSIFKTMHTLLLNDNTYQFDVKKKCVFVPNLALKLKLEEKKLIILIGISCKQVRFILGEEIITFDIDPAFPEIEEVLNALRRKNQ